MGVPCVQYFCCMLSLSFKLNTISKRLFFSFGMLLISLVIISLLSLLFQRKTRSIHAIGHAIDNQRVLIIQLIKTDLDFLRFETVNQEFFASQKSLLLDSRFNLAEAIWTHNDSLRKSMLRHDFLIEDHFNQTDSLLHAYHATFHQLIKRIKKRGYKDYGLEGTMREYAHALENKESRIPLATLLMLRRHEKDFFLRKEEKYVQLFNVLADSLTKDLYAHKKIHAILHDYQLAFNNLVELDRQIGITPSDGLLGQLNLQTKFISANLEELTKLSSERSTEVVKESAILFIAIGLITLFISIASVYYTSILLTRPIKKLSLSMGKFIVNEGLNEKDWEDTTDTYEVNHLAQSFITMSRKLRTQFAEIQQSSKLLEEQNQALKKLNGELDRFIYSAAHDLKSPLASLSGLVHLARIEVNQAEHDHYFERMETSITKLESFIKDITDYAKNKRQRLKVESLDIQKVLEGVLADLQFLPQANAIQPFLRVAGGAFHTDRTRLEIVLKNMLSNAYRYYDKRKKNSYIFIEASIEKDRLSLEIFDNGIGIGEQHLSKIFDMFYRAVDTAHGTGIGLFLVKESVKMLRGTLSVKSSLGEWTRFTITLPNLKEGLVDEPEMEQVVLESNVH